MLKNFPNAPLEASSGNVVWQAPSPSDQWPSLAPIGYGNVLAVPEADARISVLAADAGQVLWRAYGPSDKTRSAWVESVALGPDTVYVARLNWRLTAYSLVSGGFIWETDVPGRTPLYVVADRDVVYLGAARQLSAFNAQDGTALWHENYDGLVGPLLLNGNTLYVAIPDGPKSLVAVDTRTHHELWAVSSSEIQDGELRALAVADNVLFVSGQRLSALSTADGTILWRSNPTVLLERPVILNGRVYARSQKTTLFVFDAATGQETGRMLVQSDSPMLTDPGREPAAAGDLLIVPFGDNRLFA